jgi:hypothetical protein
MRSLEPPLATSPPHEAIRLYCGCGEEEWNGTPVQVGPFACVSPIYGRSAATKRTTSVNLSLDTTAVIQDSGAFCDGPGQRLTFHDALNRQVQHAEKYRYAERVTHRASYDVLVGEKWTEGSRRSQSRWSEADAWAACIETIQAAKYLATHREGLYGIFSVQGITCAHYLKCAQAVLPYLHPGDMLGMGGWCVLGKFPRQFMPTFRETIHALIPFVAHEGVTWIHLWGCMYAPALGELLYLCDRHEIRVSVDSIGPSLRPILGKWGYWSWTNPRYQRPPAGPELGRHRRIHVKASRRWLSQFRDREHSLCRWQPKPSPWTFF